MSDERVRPTLSKELIADTAMRMTLEQPDSPLTLARLGAFLEADPTALYRHYRSRDELMLDLGDRLYEKAVASCQIGDDWRSALSEVAHKTRKVLLERPALASEVGTRFTGGPGERAAAKLIGDVFELAGFDRASVVANTRAFGELLMSHIVSTAEYLILPEATRASDAIIDERLYGPSTGAIDDQTNEAFDLILTTYIAGLSAQLADQDPN